ncbi:MAG: TonB-dependent receptor [Gammaproteobacteria bacterium]
MTPQKHYRALLALACLSIGVANVRAEPSPRSLRFDITSQSLAQALRSYGQISGQEIIFTQDLVDGKTVAALKGDYTAQAALERLLERTGLTAERSTSGVLMIRRSEQPTKTFYAAAPRVVAFTDGAAAGSTQASSGAAPADAQDVLQEITVTSTRQAQPLSKVPLSVVATDQETLDKQGVRSADDLMRLTPSITFGQGGEYYGTGQTNISIRGIQSTSGVPTTGVYIDDTPIQSRTGISPSLTNAYPKIFDLNRVEVLRGPQGTLFGTGSMGGAVRFITPDPVYATPEFYARSEMNSTRHGDTGYELGLAGGAPLVEDVLGFRASFWHQKEGGYLDRLDRVSKAVTDRDINSEESNVGRVALGWKPLDNVTITPSVFFQQVRIDDTSLLEVATSDMHGNDYRNSLYAIPEPHTDRFWLPALKVEVGLGNATLISNTSYFTRKTATVSDDTSLNVALWGGYSGSSIPLEFVSNRAHTDNETTQKGWTQEIRLQSTNPNQRFNWVAGAFYSSSTTRDAFDAANTDLLQMINYGLENAGEDPVASVAEFLGTDLYQGLYVVSQRSRYKDVQKSVFAQADYAIVPRLKLTAGLRYTDAVFDYQNFVAGPLYSTDEGITTTLSPSSKDVTPKFGVSYQATDTNLFYANAAKGVRGSSVADPVGTSCANDAATLGFDPLAPRKIESDSLWSYEVGSKNQLLDGRMGIDASAYHEEWKNVQTNTLLPECGVLTTMNLGEAQIDGVDLSVMVLAARGLALGASVSYMDARYSSALVVNDTAIRRKGEPLGVAPWSMHLSGEYQFMVRARELYVRTDYTHSAHDNTALDVDSPLVDPDIPRTPATSSLDLRSGVRFGALDVSVFASNVLDEGPLLSLGHDDRGSGFYRSTTFRPRMIGITATFRK